MLFFFSFYHANSKSVTLKSFSHSNKCFSPRPRLPMKRFLSSRSSSQQELQPVEDLRAERAAIALSVGLSWPPDRFTKTSHGRPSRQQLWERALQDHIMNRHELPQGISLQRPAWWRPEAIDRPLTHEELANIKTPCAATAAPATPADALVEDKPSGSASKRHKVHPIARDWFWDMQRCLGEVQRLYPGMFDGINPNTPYRWKRSAPRAAPLGRKTLLSPADTTRLSEHIMRVTDVLCLSAVTIRGLVYEWLDAEELDVRPGDTWVRQLLRGMRLSFKKPAKCLKELHTLEQQHANAHRLFIKLCWLMEKHAVSADRVVNVDETSCRLLPVHQTGWGRRGKKQDQMQGNTKEATTFTVAFSMDRGPLDMLVQIVHAGETGAVLPEQPWPERTHHVTSENGWATTTTILQLAAALDNVLYPGREGQSWILLWDMASIHASEATLAAMRATFPHVVLCFLPPQSTSYLQPCDVAVFRSFKSCIQAQASATLARSVLDGSFDGLAMNKASLRPSGHLAQSQTFWTRARLGQLGGVACVPTAMPTSKKPSQRPRRLLAMHIEPSSAPSSASTSSSFRSSLLSRTGHCLFYLAAVVCASDKASNRSACTCVSLIAAEKHKF